MKKVGSNQSTLGGFFSVLCRLVDLEAYPITRRVVVAHQKLQTLINHCFHILCMNSCKQITLMLLGAHLDSTM